MTKRIKKGQKGNITQFITRSKAIRKLQLSLKDFRRLCILKGIYPREPRKKAQGPTKTYYHIKDINFLSHEKILSTFRAIQSHMRKYKKTMRRGEALKAQKMLDNKPEYHLNHLIKERYPSFVDALRDLDDPLCLINLFAAVPSHKELGIARERVVKCMELVRDFNYYVVQSKSLRKAFLSVKGIYYQAEIMGEKITWIVPYKFPQSLAVEVDYRVMLTFLEFYEVLIRFVNFKLYLNAGLKYPPTPSDSANFSLKALLLEKIEKLDSEDDKKYEISAEFANFYQKNDNINLELFKDFVFYLNREVPKESLEFVITSFGGKVYWEGDNQNITEKSSEITHFITDRDPKTLEIKKGREYIQPQWVYDCINNSILLSVKEYQPGKLLPPHLSPFVEVTKEEEEHIPERAKELAKEKKNKKGDHKTKNEKENNEVQLQEIEDENEEFDVEKEVIKGKKKAKLNKEEEKQLAKSLMPKKSRKMLERMEFNKHKKMEKKAQLEQKSKNIKAQKKKTN